MVRPCIFISEMKKLRLTEFNMTRGAERGVRDKPDWFEYMLSFHVYEHRAL